MIRKKLPTREQHLLNTIRKSYDESGAYPWGGRLVYSFNGCRSCGCPFIVVTGPPGNKVGIGCVSYAFHERPKIGHIPMTHEKAAKLIIAMEQDIKQMLDNHCGCQYLLF